MYLVSSYELEGNTMNRDVWLAGDYTKRKQIQIAPKIDNVDVDMQSTHFIFFI